MTDQVSLQTNELRFSADEAADGIGKLHVAREVSAAFRSGNGSLRPSICAVAWLSGIEQRVCVAFVKPQPTHEESHRARPRALLHATLEVAHRAGAQVAARGQVVLSQRASPAILAK
jgi:hypothetical protein